MGVAFEKALDRLHGLHPKLIDLSLDRIAVLLRRLDHPERRLPPTIHVAGTNGKGSTCAFLRAAAEAAGQRVHVYTSPHLVHFNERIRIAGELVSDGALEAALDEVEAANEGAPITVFEVITAVALLLFARVPAELCILEVGLGGRGDATNVVTPAIAAITSLSLDHCDMLGDTLEAIAAEKAGILKPGVPLVTGLQPPSALSVIERMAEAKHAPLLRRGREWTIAEHQGALRYEDHLGVLDLPAPSLHGRHQHDNAGIAVACLRSMMPQLERDALAKGLTTAVWPARLQRLSGSLAKNLPPGWQLWLDGGHNPGAGTALAQVVANWNDMPLHLIVGMKQSKDAIEFLRPLLPVAASVFAVAEADQHLAATPDALVAASGGRAVPGPDVAGALAQLAERENVPARILICGSLYLAGHVLRKDSHLSAA